MKKKLLLPLIALLSLFLVVGCSNSDSSSTEESQPAETTSQEAEVPEESEEAEEAEESEAEGEEDTEVEGDKVLTIGNDGATDGIAMLNDDGELEGFEIDVWNEIGKRTGYEIEFEVLDFKGLWPLLDDGRIDTIGNIVTPNEERVEIYDFTDSYLFDEYYLLSAPDVEINSFKDLDGMSIGLIPSSAMVPMMDEFQEKHGITLEYVNYDDTATHDVANGRVDLAIQNGTQAFNTVKKIGEDKIKVLTGLEEFAEMAWPFVKDNEEQAKIREMVDKTLDEMQADGTLAELSEKWFGADLTAAPGEGEEEESEEAA